MDTSKAMHLFTLPPGSRVKAFANQMIVCEPNEPPYFVRVDLGPGGITCVVKTAIIADCEASLTIGTVNT